MESRDNKNAELLDAAIKNDVQCVKKLLKQGADPNYCEDQCMIRPLHFACSYNSIDVLFYLIKAGANTQAKTSDGSTPLDIAKQLNHKKIIEKLNFLTNNLTQLFNE